jgi:hypothetical protein
VAPTISEWSSDSSAKTSLSAVKRLRLSGEFSAAFSRTSGLGSLDGASVSISDMFILDLPLFTLSLFACFVNLFVICNHLLFKSFVLEYAHFADPVKYLNMLSAPLVFVGNLIR